MSGPNNPRILLVTPEITYLPEGMGNLANYLNAKAGGLADVSASLVSSLYEKGLDVHVALPNYRAMFSRKIGKIIDRALAVYRSKLSEEHIHLAEDRCFYYRDQVYDNFAAQNLKLSLAFQREVINNIMPRVQPDLIHCNDWMTGLIPAIAKRLGIPCLFTIHNIHSIKSKLEKIEDHGIDAAEFWPLLYFERPPRNYEETRSANPVDFLASGIMSASYVNTVSPKFLDEIVQGRHSFISEPIVREFRNKAHASAAAGVLNSPDPSFNPETDEALFCRYNVENHEEGKRKNKLALQHRLGLIEDPDAPIFFWPSRLDPVQKGCALLEEIFYDVISRYSRERLQVVMVANGPGPHMLGHCQKTAMLARTVVVNLTGRVVGKDQPVPRCHVIRFLRAAPQIVLCQPKVIQPRGDAIGVNMRTVVRGTGQRQMFAVQAILGSGTRCNQRQPLDHFC